MKKSVLTPEEKKARKAASDKAYRERKKAGLVGRPTEAETPAPVKEAKPAKEVPTSEQVEGTFTETFGFPVRLYWNQRYEDVNSSCAKPGTELTFEPIGKKGKNVTYRVRRGKRNFFTTSKELVQK